MGVSELFNAHTGPARDDEDGGTCDAGPEAWRRHCACGRWAMAGLLTSRGGLHMHTVCEGGVVVRSWVVCEASRLVLLRPQRAYSIYNARGASQSGGDEVAIE